MSGADITCLVYLFTSNRRRDRVYGPADKEASGEAGMRDYIIKLWKESYVYLYPGYHGRVPPLFLEMSKDSADAEKPIFP